MTVAEASWMVIFHSLYGETTASSYKGEQSRAKEWRGQETGECVVTKISEGLEERQRSN